MPSLPFVSHDYKLFIMTSIIEGLLGGFSSIQSATSSYISDCTSYGSHARIFSRFMSAFYISSAIGPILAGFLVQHPMMVFGRRFPFGSGKADASVFWVAMTFSAVNFLMALFVIPESLGRKKRERAIQEYNKTGGSSKGKAKKLLNLRIDGVTSIDEQGVKMSENTTSSSTRFLTPLLMLLPVIIVSPSGIVRKRRDWNLTLLAVGLFAFMLSTVNALGCCFALFAGNLILLCHRGSSM